MSKESADISWLSLPDMILPKALQKIVYSYVDTEYLDDQKEFLTPLLEKNISIDPVLLENLMERLTERLPKEAQKAEKKKTNKSKPKVKHLPFFQDEFKKLNINPKGYSGELKYCYSFLTHYYTVFSGELRTFKANPHINKEHYYNIANNLLGLINLGLLCNPDLTGKLIFEFFYLSLLAYHNNPLLNNKLLSPDAKAKEEKLPAQKLRQRSILEVIFTHLVQIKAPIPVIELINFLNLNLIILYINHKYDDGLKQFIFSKNEIEKNDKNDFECTLKKVKSQLNSRSLDPKHSYDTLVHFFVDKKLNISIESLATSFTPFNCPKKI